MTEFDQREYQTVILAALLHDVGKFVQRSQKNPRSQAHSRWGEEWFQENLAEKLTPFFSEDEKQIIRAAISNHHEHEKYISLADAISAGMDRVKINLEDEEKGDPFTDRLISVFSRISISNNPKREMYNRLISLGDSLKETFPIEDKKCNRQEYSALLKDFEREIKSILSNGNLSHEIIIDCIYFCLWKYAWCIPSATYEHEPDVSLFDHLKTTAAIAGCLYAYQEENPGESLNLGSKAFCLIGGDISGIQSYIFDVLSQQGKVASAFPT